MKRIIRSLAFLVSIAIFSIPKSCSDCAFCYLYDDDGYYLGGDQICDEDLEVARTDTDHFECY